MSDQLTLATSPCACGRTLAHVVELRGRADDILELPAAHGGRLRLHPIHLRSPMPTVREVISYQIVQRRDALDVEVVLAAPDATIPDRLAELLAAVLRERGIAELPLRVRAVDAIARAVFLKRVAAR